MATENYSNGRAVANDISMQDSNNGPAVPPSEEAGVQSVIPRGNSSKQEVSVRATNVPTIIVEDTDSETKRPIASETSQTVENAQIDVTYLPGALPPGSVPVIPDWYRVGWRQVSGIDDPLPEGHEKDRTVLNMFLSEQFYGSWYHNAAIIVFAVFASHFFTRFNFGWGWLFITLAICSTYYTTSLDRVRRRARDDIQRELVKTRLASEHESADWMNNFLDRFWLMYEPVLSITIKDSVNQVLSTNTPPFLDSLRLSSCTLGTKAPRIDKVRTFPTTPDDVVMMDWGLSFTPNDVSNMIPKKVATKQNPKIVLDVHIGKGFATAAMPILVEDITFSGLMRIRLKLMSNFPHVQILDFTFLEKPVIDYVLKPIGGETFGFDIANIPGLSSFIRDMTHLTLQPMMYDPFVFTLNLEQMLSGKPLDAAIGVIQVTVQSARGIRGTKIGGGTPDPYISLTFNNRAELSRTKYKHNTYNPTWMETKYLLVKSLDETLTLQLWDYNDHMKDSLVASTAFELSKLRQEAICEDIRSQLLHDGKERGELRYDVSYYPILETEEASQAADSSVGVVRLTIHQAKDLDNTKSMSGELNPLAKVYLGSSKAAEHSTSRTKRTLNPVWESPYEFICPDKASSIIGIEVANREFSKDVNVGYLSIKLTDLLDRMGEAGRDWFPLSSCQSGKIRVSAEWKPLDMACGLQGADQYVPPIGVVRLLLDRATGIKNAEATLGGRSDPYVRVQVNNITKARTEVVNNNLNPVWDEIVYVPVHSLRETLLLECMDYENFSKDRSIGSVELRVSDLANKSGHDRYPYESTGAKAAVDAHALQLDIGTYRGNLMYGATFIPAVALKGVKFGDGKHGGEALDLEDNVEGLSSSTVPDDGYPPMEVTIEPTQKGSSGSLVAKEVEAEPHSTQIDHPTHTGLANEAVNDNSSEGVEMTIEELLAQQSGIVVFNVISGTLATKARLEVALDDGYWPCFSTPKSWSTKNTREYVGEGFIKEIDFSRVWLRLNEADEGSKDNIIAEWKGDAKSFLQSTLSGPQMLTLVDENGKNSSTVTIEARYVPVPVVLEPRETVNNQGVLQVDLLDGDHIQGVDRGGKSDPYAVFYLNEEKVFKSQVKKRTLNPTWNENFTVSVPSRSAADFSVEVFDWNQLEQAKSLGVAKIDVNSIEPFVPAERTLYLVSEKHGEKGYVRLRLLFRPEIIIKTRKNTSTFTAAGRAVTQFGALPVSAGKGVFHGVTGVFRKGNQSNEYLADFSSERPSQTPDQLETRGNIMTQIPILPTSVGQVVFNGVPGVVNRGNDKPGPLPDLPSEHLSHSVGTFDGQEAQSGAFSPFKRSEDREHHEHGTLRVTVLDAKNLSPSESKAYTTIRIGDKECKTKHVGKTTTPQWNESFVFAAGPLTPKVFVWVHDHKTLGKDKDLGEGEVDIWHHLRPEGTSSAEVSVDLRQGGQLRLRLEFDADNSLLAGSFSGASLANSERMTRTVSLTASPSRFSLGRARRQGADHDE